ncbi:unnamed protein product [Prorocentrum cordatum]|uniref:VWFA domain-containing protein n=1 Tax=Prorocentrum cordatum TaxID=2364126 RepID=A0ABN9UYJ5_9DINO|nr:unnamed protein product [Polarella glacialis]
MQRGPGPEGALAPGHGAGAAGSGSDAGSPDDGTDSQSWALLGGSTGSGGDGLQAISAIFQLPLSGQNYESSFLSVPCYADLVRAVTEHVSPRTTDFGIWLDEVRLTNENTREQLRQLSRGPGGARSLCFQVIEVQLAGDSEGGPVTAGSSAGDVGTEAAVAEGDDDPPSASEPVGGHSAAAVAHAPAPVARPLLDLGAVGGIARMSGVVIGASLAWWKQNRERDRMAVVILSQRQEIRAKEEAIRSLGSKLEAKEAAISKLEKRLDAMAGKAREQEDIIKTLVAQQNMNKTVDRIKEYNAADLLFVVDCTGSMGPYIEGVKTHIRSIARKLVERYPHLDLRLGFLGYRDLHDKSTQFEMHDFSGDVDKFVGFVGNVKAIVNADKAEDVAGALKNAAGWHWKHNVRVLFHMADDPCHGSKYRSEEFRGNQRYDLYPEGTPEVDIVEQLRLLMEVQAVDYYFGRITSSTDKMIHELNKELGTPYIKMISIEAPWKIEDAVVQSVQRSIDTIRHDLAAQDVDFDMASWSETD